MKIFAKVKRYFRQKERLNGSKTHTNSAVMSSKPFNIYLMYQWLKWDISHGGKIK
jgi:hypothetical protein